MKFFAIKIAGKFFQSLPEITSLKRARCELESRPRNTSLPYSSPGVAPGFLAPVSLFTLLSKIKGNGAIFLCSGELSTAVDNFVCNFYRLLFLLLGGGGASREVNGVWMNFGKGR